MPLTPEELEEMHETLKQAYTKAAQAFKSFEIYGDSEPRRAAITSVSAAATALLLADERLEQAGQAGQISKLGTKLPGKPG